MSYGKFGMKMRYNPYMSPQEQFGESLGTVLGTIWGENYNRRGIEKGEQEALKALYGEGESSGAIGGSNGGSNNVPQELYQQAVGSGAIGASGNTPSAQASASTQPAAGSVIGASGDSGLNDKISAQDKIANEKWGILSAKYGSGTDNPDGDKKIIGQTASTISNNLSSIPRGQLPITDSKALSYSIEAQLRKNGRTDYQIQQIMKNIGPKLDSVVDSNKNAVWDSLYEQYKQQVQRGEYDASSVTMADMAKYNPERTKALQNQYNRNQNDFKTQYDLDQKIAFLKKNDSSLTDKQARNLAMYNSIYSPTEMAAMGYTPNGRGGYSAPRISASGGGAGGGRSRGGGGDGSESNGFMMNNANVKYAMDRAAALQEKSNEAGLSMDEQAELDYLNNTYLPDAKIAAGVIPVTGAWINGKVDAMLNNGYSDDDILAFAEQRFGYNSGPYRDVVERLKVRRDAQTDNGYDVDTYYDENQTVSQEVAAQKAADEKAQDEYNASHHTGLLASLEDLEEKWKNFHMSDIATWAKTH